MSWEEIKLQVGDEVKKLLEERHISEEEAKQVIDFAETGGEKLYQPEANRYLAKKRLKEVVIYVEYSTDEKGYIIHTAYSHRSKIGGE
jgi:hypothetical protein